VHHCWHQFLLTSICKSNREGSDLTAGDMQVIIPLQCPQVIETAASRTLSLNCSPTHYAGAYRPTSGASAGDCMPSSATLGKKHDLPPVKPASSTKPPPPATRLRPAHRLHAAGQTREIDVARARPSASPSMKAHHDLPGHFPVISNTNATRYATRNGRKIALHCQQGGSQALASTQGAQAGGANKTTAGRH